MQYIKTQFFKVLEEKKKKENMRQYLASLEWLRNTSFNNTKHKLYVYTLSKVSGESVLK